MLIQRKVNKTRSNIYTNYKWTSVFFKYLILITLFFVVPTVVVGIFTISYYNGKNENAQRVEYINIVSKCSGVIEKSLSVVYEDAQYISINERIGNLLKSDNVLNKKTIQLAAEVYNTVNDRVCDSVYLYSLKSGYVFSCKGFGSNYFDRFPDKNWLERCGEPMPIYRHFLYANRSYGYISVITPISYLNEHVGYAVHNIDTWSFDEELMNILKQEDCLLLTDNDGTVIYATDKTLIGTSVNVEEYKNGKPIIRYADDEIYVSSEIESNGLNCIIKAPRYPLKYQRFTFAGAVTAIMLLIIILSIFLVFIIASNFYRQIQNILDLFNGTQEEVAENGINEFSYISANIIGLMEKNKLTEIQLAARIEQVRETQRILAQSRINSHFLMNTLHLVNVVIMSVVKKENKATYAIKLLSDMLKSSLNSTRTIIPLSEDVEFAEKYMQIVNMRYDNVVKIIWNIKEEHLGVYVPKLMLQPIIENAVAHGLLPSKNENKTIEISSFEEKGSVYVVVSDNGVGIEENKQKEINLMMSESFEKWSYCMIKKNRFGLDNTNKCLKLIFGDEYGCRIESNPGHGTRVYIKIKKS